MIHEGMNQSEFSNATGIATASLSSIFTGRTSPTLKHAEALHQHFPQLNMSWLLFGDGEMMLPNDGQGAESSSTDNNQPGSGIQFGGISSPSLSFPTDGDLSTDANHFDYTNVLEANSRSSINTSQVIQPQTQIPLELLKKLDIKPRRIAEIRIFFDDGTYEVFKGNI